MKLLVLRGIALLGLALLGLAGCAPTLPPAPAIVPAPAVGFLPDSMVPSAVTPASAAEAAADALALDDLAAATPDAAVPVFDGRGIRWDIDVVSYARHPRVRYYLDYFQGPGRAGMAVFLERGARYESLIRERFEAEGLPGDLGYLALIESGYSNDAVSRAHAVGMWQFMRRTGQGYGLRVDSWVDERRDPQRATDAAARHLRDLRTRFGSLYLAAAAYNAGAGKVSRGLGKLQWEEPAEVTDTAADTAAEPADTAAAPADPIAEPGADEPLDEVSAGVTSDAAYFRLAGADLLAAETQNYVPKLIAAAIIAKDLERYEFAPVVAAPLAYDSLVVHDATGLDVVARLAGTTLSEVRDLNPQYLRLATPPRSQSVIRLPAGTGATVATGYSVLPRSARVHYLTHVVRRRERLTTIARRYHLPLADIRSANPRAGGDRPRQGTRLVIPAAAIPSLLAMRAAGVRLGSGEVRSRPAGPRARVALTTHRVTHRVRRGETLTGIARRYRVSVRAIRRANALPRQYGLRAGMRLRIPA